MKRSGNRVLALTIAGAADSAGLAFGWTVFTLLTVYRHGLTVAGLLNAAMLCGVALSSPAAAWVTRRLDGRRILRWTAGLESVLRAGTLALLYWNAPVALLAVLVLVTNVIAWVGYAAMRAEIAAASRGRSAMTHYVAVIIAVEAVGTTVAALLPITGHGQIAGALVGAVTLIYGISLLPTAWVARHSTIPVSAPTMPRALTSYNRRLLMSGALMMVICSGPTLLFIGLAAHLHGRTSVAGAAVAFAAGAVLAPRAGRLMNRTGLPLNVLWLTWGAGMIFGWIAAPWSLAGLWLAQFLSGVCLTGFEGAMDSLLAGSAPDGAATAALAHGSAARALGGAVAVRLVPLFATATALAELAAVSSVVCAVAALVVYRMVRGVVVLEPGAFLCAGAQPVPVGDP